MGETRGFDFEDDRFVYYLDPETEPDPYFEGMSWEQIKAELDRLEEEAWQQEQLYWMEYQWLQENGWYKDCE